MSTDANWTAANECPALTSGRTIKNFLEKLFDLLKSRHNHVDSMGDAIEHQHYENESNNHGN